NLYIIAAPGLLIPLLWWFVTRPLGASSATTGGAIPLAVTAAIATALTAIVLAHQFDLTSFGLRPDLATPVLAAVILLALIINTPPRPLRRMFSRDLRAFSRTLVTLVALIGLALVAWNIVATLRWYNALVQGNRLVEQAIAPGGCAAGDAPCEPLAQAIDHYTRAICLQPGDSEGYALRGFARLARRDYEQSRLDFVRALGEEQPDRSCPRHAIPQPSESQRRSLHANIAAVDALLAHQQDYSAADSRYRNALLNYALALSLPADDPRSLECAPLAARLLRPDSPASAVTGVDLLATENLTIRSDHAPVALQLADACYSRGSARLAAIATQKPPMIEGAREAMRRSAWQDLAASIAEYRAVVASGDPDDRALARRGVAAGWLALSQIDQPPIGGPDRGTALLRAMSAYQELAGTLRDDPAIFAGQAWSSIQLGAWSSARAPLAEAARLRPGDPTYPALQGLTSWLDSMQYVPPRKGAPSLSYTAAISSALGLYSRVIELGQVDMARAYATRSVLYFSLRNSPHPLVGPARSETYHDQDYGAWMRLALADANQAVLEAEHAGLTPDQQVGYRYWRGRLAFTLALTWQEKSRGLHDWQELMPLYGSAYEDFSSDLALDRDPGRITIFRDTWVPWSQTLLANATHMQLAREAAERGEFAKARAELALVSPDPSPLRRWDERSAPLPDYHLLHGLISLGLGMPVDFPNPLLKR
ncbi:MAG TPA: hypothetical protein VF909_00195, partial [Roseiflexaceae bacterium]